MTADRLQLPLLLDLQPLRQPLPPDARKKSIEIIARMLLQVLKAEAQRGQEFDSDCVDALVDRMKPRRDVLPLSARPTYS